MPEELCVELGRIEVEIALSDDVKGAVASEICMASVELRGQCNVFVSDSRSLITISEVPGRSALILADRSIIEAVKEYFKNPKCITQ